MSDILLHARKLWAIKGITTEQKKEAEIFINKQSQVTYTFIIMSVLSTIIAAYGLLSNSTAVVIGAMLLAPLMGPIFGIALGLSISDIKLLRRALVAECIGVLIVIVVSSIIGILPWHLEFGSEIIARTHPTMFDLAIALASGLAGAYAMLNEKVSYSITGVAIATALVPPLTTCGLCLSNKNYDWAMGAFILFLANFLAIQLAGAIVFTGFRLQSLRPDANHSFFHLLRRFWVSLVLLIIVSLFLWKTLYSLVISERLTNALRRELSNEITITTGAMLEKVTFERYGGELQVMAVVLTPHEFDAENVALLEEALRKKVDPRTRLIIRSLISKDSDRQGIVFLSKSAEMHLKEVTIDNNQLTLVSKELQRQFSYIPGARLVDLRRESGDKKNIFTAVVRTPSPIEPSQVSALQSTLRSGVTPSLKLIIRSVITRDADDQQYLYQPVNTVKIASPREIRQRKWFEKAFRNQLYKRVPGAKLQELRYAYHGNKLKIFVIIRSPYTITDTLVKQLQGTLRWYIDPKLDLFVRSVVGADVGANGYVSTFDENMY